MIDKEVMRIMNNNCLNEEISEIVHAIADIDEQLNSIKTDYNKICAITVNVKKISK